MNLWVFDNDGTLYDDTTLSEQFMKIAFAYYGSILSIPSDEIPNEIARLKKKWKTQFSIIAVAKEYGIDFADAVNNTYFRVKLEECRISNPDLVKSEVLNSLPGRKIVFTNNPSTWARRVLSYAGLLNCFSDIIGMEETRFCIKPQREAYRVVEERHKGFDRIIFCDDSLKNLETARQLGWTTVWYRSPHARAEIADGHVVISSFDELRQFL